MERNLAQRPGVTPGRVKLLAGERAQADLPDQGEAPQPASGLVQVILGEGARSAGVVIVEPCQASGSAGQPASRASISAR